jgi:hypothetical protein
VRSVWCLGLVLKRKRAPSPAFILHLVPWAQRGLALLQFGFCIAKSEFGENRSTQFAIILLSYYYNNNQDYHLLICACQCNRCAKRGQWQLHIFIESTPPHQALAKKYTPELTELKPQTGLGLRTGASRGGAPRRGAHCVEWFVRTGPVVPAAPRLLHTATYTSVVSKSRLRRESNHIRYRTQWV